MKEYRCTFAGKPSAKMAQVISTDVNESKNHLWIHWSQVPVWPPTPRPSQSWNDSSAFSQQHTGLQEILHFCQELRTLPVLWKAKVELGDTWICSFALNGSPKKVSKLDSPFSLLFPGLTDKSEQGEGHQCLLTLTSQWAGTHCPGTAGGPCWLFCLLFYLVRDNRSVCSVTLTQAMQG